MTERRAAHDAAVGTGGPAGSRALLVFGRICFGLGLAGIGFTHFTFQQFTTGRAPPWPAWLPGEAVLVHASGAFVVALGLAISIRRYPRAAALTGAIMIAGWALLRQIPVLFGVSFLAGAWTHAGKALVLTGGLLAAAALAPGARTPPADRPAGSADPFITAARVCLGIFLLITGAQHFVHTTFVASLIPVWFPGDAVFWTRFAGVALLAGGAGLLVPRTAALAASGAGLMVFSWFWIIHVPRALASDSDGIAVFEALAVAGIAFILAGALSGHRRDVRIDRPATTASQHAASESVR